jgi:hypothetical protein
MRNYIAEHNALQNDITNDMLDRFKKVYNKIGVDHFKFGNDALTKQPLIYDRVEAIPVSFGMRLKGWYTKVNHIFIDKNCGSPPLIVKGFQVGRGKYRLLSFKDLTIHEKQQVLEIFNKKFDILL